MISVTMLRSSALVLAVTLSLSCSSGGGGGGAVSGRVQISGTVAAEQAIGITSIGFRDSKGKILFISTQPDGTFSADIGSPGLTLPVISRSPNPGTGRFMYSYASAEGTSNIHPLTDPILRLWFKAKGLSGNIDSDFISATPFTLPTDSEVAAIKAILSLIITDYFKAASLSSTSFDLITSPFIANGSGFDNILKGIRIDTTDTGELNISVMPFTTLDTAVTDSGFAPVAFLDSSIISLATDTTPPAPPTGLAAAALCGNRALVTWSTSTSGDVASYQVFEQTKGRIGTVTYPAFIVPNLTSLESYTFSASSVDAAGLVSTASNSSAVLSTPCSLQPLPPSALSSAPTVSALSSSQLRLDWTDSQPNIIRYNIYSVGTSTVLKSRTISKSFTDFQLVPGTQYCYAVTVVNALVLESAPTVACGTTLPGVPPAPKNVAAAKTGSGQVTVSWDAVGNAASYRLYHAKQAGLTKANYATLSGGTLLSGITGTSANVISLAAGITYHFIVTAVNGSGESVESVEVSATP